MKWQSAWWLTKKEFKYSRIAFVASLAAFLLLAIALGAGFKELFKYLLGETTTYNHFLLDLLFTVVILSFGILFVSGPYLTFQAIKEDPFSKKMALYRSLAIPVDVLTLSRTLGMLVNLLIMGTSFFTLLYLSQSTTFNLFFSMENYIAFVLLCLGIALFFGGLSIFIENGASGMILLLSSGFYILLYVSVKSFIYFALGKGMVEAAVLLVVQHGWTGPLISLSLGIGSCFAWNSLLKQRLLKRDYV